MSRTQPQAISFSLPLGTFEIREATYVKKIIIKKKKEKEEKKINHTSPHKYGWQVIVGNSPLVGCPEPSSIIAQKKRRPKTPKEEAGK